jgi:hypothetical protein
MIRGAASAGARFVALSAVGGAVLAACSEPPAGSAPESGVSAGPPWFADEAVARGLAFAHESGYSGRYLFPEIVCGGAALFDMDQDGDLDAYLVQSDGVLAPRAERAPNRLFRNAGDGTFADATAGSGADERGYGMGAATGDADGDGDLELYVTNLDGNALLRNDGGGRFQDVTQASGTAVGSWSSSAGFLDHDLDGDLDLFVVNYLHWSEAYERTCYAKPHGETYCGPSSYDRPAPDTLLRNDGGLRFTDVSREAGVADVLGNGLGLACLDVELDGWPDVFVANDASPNHLFVNQKDGRFADRALSLGCSADQDGMVKAGMGVGVGDVDEDGDEDVLVVNMQNEPDSYFRNERAHFVDRTAATGLKAATRPWTRFGVGFHDFDHDALLDLYVANGNILHSHKSYGSDPFAEPNLLFRGLGGARFAEVEPRGGTVPLLAHTSRGAAFGDVDADGDVDVLVSNKDGPAYLLINCAAKQGHWLGLRVVQEGRDALGATVQVRVGGRTLARIVRSAYSYCAASDVRVHVGLGAASAADEVRVRWPGGPEESFGALAGDRYWTLTRGAGAR